MWGTILGLVSRVNLKSIGYIVGAISGGIALKKGYDFIKGVFTKSPDEVYLDQFSSTYSNMPVKPKEYYVKKARQLIDAFGTSENWWYRTIDENEEQALKILEPMSLNEFNIVSGYYNSFSYTDSLRDDIRTYIGDDNLIRVAHLNI